MASKKPAAKPSKSTKAAKPPVEVEEAEETEEEEEIEEEEEEEEEEEPEDDEEEDEPPAKKKKPKKSVGPLKDKAAAPAGYETVSDDIVGFYRGVGTIHIIPKHVTLSDNSQDTEKSSSLITGTLFAPGKLVKKDETGEEEIIQGKKGDTVGVWYKPGMSTIRGMAGIPVFIRPAGTKKIKGRQDPMDLFDCMKNPKDVGTQLQVTADYRDESTHAKNPFVKKNKRPTMAGGEADADEGF